MLGARHPAALNAAARQRQTQQALATRVCSRSLCGVLQRRVAAWVHLKSYQLFTVQAPMQSAA